MSEEKHLSKYRRLTTIKVIVLLNILYHINALILLLQLFVNYRFVTPNKANKVYKSFLAISYLLSYNTLSFKTNSQSRLF